MARGFGLLAGILTHLLFAVTVCRLFPFLQGTSRGLLSDWAALHAPLPWWGWDLLLAAQFGAVHSWLLRPGTRDRLERVVPSAFYGCLFCVATCLNLLTAIELWMPHPLALYRATGLAGWAVRAAFIFCWPALIYSLSLTGLGYQTGFTPWWSWVKRRRPPRRVFEPRGLYRVLRHPVYLSFLGLVWITPAMTLDRAVLTAVWTAYIFLGSYWKDRRLLHYVGGPYRHYQAEVAGYPFMPMGPLARVPLPPPVDIPATPNRETRRIAA